MNKSIDVPSIKSQGYEQLLSYYLEELGKVGTSEVGLCRRPFTADYEKAAQMVATWMREHGLEVRKDEVGNVIGRIEGTNSQVKVIATGSHLDTVRGGGKYDGMLGVVGGVIAAGYLLKNYGQPEHSIEVIAFTGEEGSRFGGFLGSKWMAGALGEKDINSKDEKGISVKEAATALGYNLSEELIAVRKDIEAFLELHIEQGPVLEAAGCPIGIVSAITGMRQAEVIVHGRTDHAGTTPLNMRQDALLSAVKIIKALDACVRQSGGDTVFTVGQIDANPGSVNVVAERCAFTIDLRDPDPSKLSGLYEKCLEEARTQAAQAGVKIDWQEILTVEPVPCSVRLRETLAAAAKTVGLDCQPIVSGAGHDALMMAEIAAVGMVFVPSAGGRSHCSEEYTPADQCLAGVCVLAEAVRQLAYN
ncbi:MAG TPA: M20 family metallo-hydrolase [Clostridiales bacterium]|nr:M20 family metallo-hydrolase [Clostridiales bacterium]